MTIQGNIKSIDDTEEFGTSGFKKRFCVITTIDQYPQIVQIQFVQDKVSLLDSYKVGDSVEVHFNVRGREWTNPKGEVKYFTDIEGWKVTGPSESVGNTTPDIPASAPLSNSDDDLDELPF